MNTLSLHSALAIPLLAALVSDAAATTVTIADGRWAIDGAVTYPGAVAEGTLVNIRMVNSVFEDARPRELWPAVLPADFDPDVNTTAFIRMLPAYKAQGVLAFTLSLQGGLPGYEGAHNSAFEADGTLRSTYMRRVRRVIEACDHEGMVVILGCFYQRQHGQPPTHLDRALHGRPAVENAVRQVAAWLREAGFRNVVMEIANEYAHQGYTRWHDGDWLRTPAAQVELMTLARSVHPALLVSTSGMGSGRIPAVIAEAADFVLIHFNNTGLEDIPERIALVQATHPGKPIVVNEDDKTGEAGARAAELCLRRGVSWGYMGSAVNQHAPFVFGGAADDPPVYALLAALTGHGEAVEASAEVVSVVLTQPSDGQAFAAGVGIDLVASILHPPGQPVRAVRFLAGEATLGVVTAPPWHLRWSAAPVGGHDLRVEVTTQDGAVVVSRPVDIVVGVDER